MIDTIGYLKRLGINAIELMPINEFDGNDSWGYNPAFYFAVDKAYGTKDKFKEFVDVCHANGIAVISRMIMSNCVAGSVRFDTEVRQHLVVSTKDTAGKDGSVIKDNIQSIMSLGKR